MAKVVSLEGKRKAPSLEPLLSLCADDMAQVDREILAPHALAGGAYSRSSPIILSAPAASACGRC